MDIKMNWETMRYLVKSCGWEWFLQFLQEKYPSLGLYSVSNHWVSNPKYICKARGTQGDLIIQWEGECQ